MIEKIFWEFNKKYKNTKIKPTKKGAKNGVYVGHNQQSLSFLQLKKFFVQAAIPFFIMHSFIKKKFKFHNIICALAKYILANNAVDFPVCLLSSDLKNKLKNCFFVVDQMNYLYNKWARFQMNSL